MGELNLSVSGMHCASCETLIAEDLLELDGVKKVEASHADGAVKIIYEGGLDESKLRQVIEELGYKVIM